MWSFKERLCRASSITTCSPSLFPTLFLNMIIELSSGYNDQKHKLDDPHHEGTSSAGPSIASPPPSFPANDYTMPGGDESTETTHLAVDFHSDAEHPTGPPPEFSPYEAEYFEVGYNDVVSHDPHLNSDGACWIPECCGLLLEG